MSNKSTHFLIFKNLLTGKIHKIKDLIWKKITKITKKEQKTNLMIFTCNFYSFLRSINNLFSINSNFIYFLFKKI